MGKGYKGRNPRGGKGPTQEDEEDWREKQASLRQQANAGMMPPSDSEEDDEEDDGSNLVKAKKVGFSDQVQVKTFEKQVGGGQPATAGMMPPDSSDEEDEEEEEEPEPEPAPAPRRKKDAPDEPDPDQIASDMERLALIRRKREEERLKRIEAEGFDRFAPKGEADKK